MAEETKETTARARKRKTLAELTPDELEQLKAREQKRLEAVIRQVSGVHPVPSTTSSSTRSTATDSAPVERRKSKRERRAARKEK